MRIVMLLLLLAAMVLGPHFWVKHVFARHGSQREDYPGTGGELARHLLDRCHLSQVKVETTDQGDHYDPQAKAVRLRAEHLTGKSLTAVTIAAHEVGHALQDHTGYQPLRERTRLVQVAQHAEKIGSFIMLGIPIVAGLSRSPAAGILVLIAGLATMGISTLIHIVTLPVEWDASFNRALPLLATGGYLSPADARGAQQILKAAALTYVAGSLASLLNLWRWLSLIRR